MGPIELIKNKTLGDFIEEHLLELNFLIKNKTKYDNETVEKVLKELFGNLYPGKMEAVYIRKKLILIII